MSQDSSTLFVRGLSWYTDEHELRAYFEQFGPTERCIVARDRDTNKSRGFGFVTFEKIEDAEKALSVEHELSNRTLYAQISIPRERPERPQFASDDGREMDTHKIYVGGLAESVGSMDLGQYFSELAEVVDATVMMDRESGRSRGFGFVAFKESVDPDRITEILDSDHILDGKSINVRMAYKRPNTPRQRSNNNDFGGGGGGGYDDDFEKVQSKPRGSRSMFRTSMPIPGTPGWPGVTGVSSSFGGVRAFSTFPALNSTSRVNLMTKAPTMRMNGPAIRNVMIKMLR